MGRGCARDAPKGTAALRKRFTVGFATRGCRTAGFGPPTLARRRRVDRNLGSRVLACTKAFLEEILSLTPESATRNGIQRALDIAADDLRTASRTLGTGNKVSAQDTVPFCLWSAAHHLDSFEEALWGTAKGLGDCDTTCAIVGGIVALSTGNVPPAWVNQREPLSTK